MRITSGGNVGIGTTSPSARLDIETSSGGYAVVIKNTSAGGDYLKMTGDSGNTAFEFGSGGTGADAFLNMYSDNSQKVLINADGSSYFNGGNVGIGTTSPNNLLTLYSASSAIYTQWVQSGTGTSSTDGLRIGLDASSNGIINLNEGTALITSIDGTERMRITSGGNVGIGTTSPTNKLTIQSNSTQLRLETASDPSGYHSFIESNYNAANPLNIYSSAAASYAFGTISLAGITGVNTYLNSYYGIIFGTSSTLISSGTVRMMITNDGNVGIGTTSPANKLDVVGDGIRTSADQSTSAFLVLAGSSSEGRITVSSYGGYQPMTFYTGGSERMRITSGGNVGIGTTAPNSLLEVNRTITFSSIDTYGQLVVKTTSGANGKLLNIGVDETNGVSFIQSLNRGTDAMPLSLQRYGGAVLIGTTTEGFLGKLQVAGSVAITGQYNTVLPSSSFSYFDGSGQVVSSSSNASALYLDTTWNTTGNPDGIYLNVTNTASGSSSKLLNLKVGSVSQFSVSKGGAIQTSDPTNGTARPWKLGDARSGGISTDSYIIVEVNGVTYSIPALNGLP
jgi:hypothetical protein